MNRKKTILIIIGILVLTGLVFGIVYLQRQPIEPRKNGVGVEIDEEIYERPQLTRLSEEELQNLDKFITQNLKNEYHPLEWPPFDGNVFKEGSIYGTRWDIDKNRMEARFHANEFRIIINFPSNLTELTPQQASKLSGKFFKTNNKNEWECRKGEGMMVYYGCRFHDENIEIGVETQLEGLDIVRIRYRLEL